MTDPFTNDPLLRRLRDLACGCGSDPCPWTKDDAFAVLERFAGGRVPEHAPGRLPNRVVIESPYGSNLDGSRADEATFARNVRYLHRCLLDSLVVRGEAPFASHAIYPRVLADSKPEERRLGMLAGFAWGASARKVAVYADFGITSGMREGIERAEAAGIPIEVRLLPASVLRAVLAG